MTGPVSATWVLERGCVGVLAGWESLRVGLGVAILVDDDGAGGVTDDPAMPSVRAVQPLRAKAATASATIPVRLGRFTDQRYPATILGGRPAFWCGRDTVRIGDYRTVTRGRLR